MSSDNQESGNLDGDNRELEGEERIQMLLKALQAQQMMIRASATEVLADIGVQDKDHKQVLPLLMEAIHDSEWWTVRFGAIDAIQGMVEQGIEIPDKIVNTLVTYLKDDDKEFRAKIASVLGIIGNKLAIPHLFNSMKDEEDETREMTAIALGKIGDNTAIITLVQLLEDSSDYVVAAVAEAIGEIAQGEGDSFQKLDSLLKIINSPDNIYKAVITSLGKIKHPGAIIPLINAFKYASTQNGRETNLNAIKMFSEEVMLKEIESAANEDENALLDLIEDLIFHYPFELLIKNSENRKKRLIGRYRRSFQRMKSEIDIINAFVADTFKNLKSVKETELKIILESIPRKRNNLARVNLEKLVKYKWVGKSLYLEIKDAQEWYKLGQGALDELENVLEAQINKLSTNLESNQ